MQDSMGYVVTTELDIKKPFRCFSAKFKTVTVLNTKQTILKGTNMSNIINKYYKYYI